LREFHYLSFVTGTDPLVFEGQWILTTYIFTSIISRCDSNYLYCPGRI